MVCPPASTLVPTCPTPLLDNDGGSSLGLGAHAGYQMKLGRTQKVALCPVANLSLGMGPDDKQADINSSQTNANFGFALGTEMGASQQMRIIPTAGLGLQYSKFKVDQAGATVLRGF